MAIVRVMGNVNTNSMRRVPAITQKMTEVINMPDRTQVFLPGFFLGKILLVFGKSAEHDVAEFSSNPAVARGLVGISLL